MNPVIQTWNGISIQSTHFRAFIPPGSHTNLSAQATYSPRVGDFPYLSMANWGGQVFPIKIILLDRGATLLLQRNILKSYFADLQPHQLVIYDQDDSNRAWYLSGIAVAIVEEDYAILTVNLALADPIWRVVTPSTSTWSITASGQTKALTVLGNYPSKPVITYTPTGSRAGGYQYKRWMPVYNPISQAYVNYPFNIVGTVLDTATLVSAGKMISDASDVALYVDGLPTNIWFQSFNTANTKVWMDLNLSPNADTTLGAVIAVSGAVPTITVNNTVANIAALKRLANAANKILVIDSEAFSYTGVTVPANSASTGTCALTGCVRAQKGSSMAAHSLNAVIHWIEHDIWLCYDWPSGPDVITVDTNQKPIISLASTNTSWIWTSFYNSVLQSPGQWVPALVSSLLNTPDVVSTAQTAIYTSDQVGFADPASEMGMSIMAFMRQNVWCADTAMLTWTMYNPSGFSNLLYSGKKYTLNTAWPAIVAFQTSVDGRTWITNLAEAVPAANTWTAFGARNQAIGTSSPYLRFILAGSVPGAAYQQVSIQWDTLTGTITSANIPQVTPGAEQATYTANFKLTNNLTGEYINIKYPAAVLNHTITIDCVNKLCYYDDGSNIPVVLSTNRKDWLNFTGGVTNTLQVDDTGIGNVTAVITWNDCQI